MGFPGPKPNIMDAFRQRLVDVREGEASVFKPDGTGYKLVARVLAIDWGQAGANGWELTLLEHDPEKSPPPT
jgi:hypothetical protein